MATDRQLALKTDLERIADYLDESIGITPEDRGYLDRKDYIHRIADAVENGAGGGGGGGGIVYHGGENITVSGNVISAPTVATKTELNTVKSGLEDDMSTLETELQASINGLTTNKQDKLTAGSNVSIASNVISATDTTYTAGTGVTITGTANAINAERHAGNTYTKTETDTLLNAKQGSLTAGTNVTITGNTISATDTTYTAGAGITITGNAIAAIMNATNTYTKAEVDALLNALNHLQLKTQATRPTTGEDNILYLIGNDTDGYRQWVYINNAWVDLGSSEVNLADYYNKTEADARYQQKLTAGTNVTITGTTIAATDTTYAAGTGITISGANNTIAADRNSTNTYTKTEVDTLLDAKQGSLTAGTNVTIAANGTISATDTTYTAGSGLKLTGTQFALADTTVSTLNGKQDALTAGTNITIASNVISATDTTYAAGLGITITGANNTIAADRNASNTYTITEVDDLLLKKITDTTSTSATIASMATNRVYVYTQPLTALTITAVQEGPTGIIFKSGATATNVTLPATVVTPENYEIKANKTYEFNIMNNLLVMGEW